MRRTILVEALDVHAEVVIEVGGEKGKGIGMSTGFEDVDALLESDDGLLLLPSTVFDAGDAHVRAGFGRADSPALMAKWRATLDDADAEREASPKTCRLDDFFMDAISRRSSPSTSALVGLEYRLFCAFRRLCAAVSTR